MGNRPRTIPDDAPAIPAVINAADVVRSRRDRAYCIHASRHNVRMSVRGRMPWAPPRMIVGTWRHPCRAMPVVPWIRIPPAIKETEAESPGHRCAIPDVADPRTIRPAGAIDNHIVRNIRTDIAGCIADIDDVRRRVVHTHVRHVVHRRTARDRIDDSRDVSRDGPGAERRRTGEPDAIVQRVERVLIDPDYRHRRIDCVLQCSALYRLKLRTAIVIYFQMPGTARNGRHLRHGACNNRFARLRRTGHRRSHTLGRMPRRDHGEIGGQRRRRHIAPLALRERGRPIPPAGNQCVVILRRQIEEQLVGRIGDIEQLRALDRRVLRGTIGLQQLGRRRADKYRQRSRRCRAIGCVRLQQIDDVLLRRKLLRLLKLRQRIRSRPRTGEGLRFHPVVGYEQVKT